MEVLYYILKIIFWIGVGFASVLFTMLLTGVFDNDEENPWKNKE